MSTLSRKQREICERERKLLDVARTMLVEHGFSGLSMDRLAEATEFSKGTIYQHFSSKEDLVTALAVQSTEQRIALIDRARLFQGRPRESMLAIIVADEFFARLHPHYFRSELVIKMANLEERASESRRESLLRCEKQAVVWLLQIIQAAVDEGDLRLNLCKTAQNVVFATFALAIGTHSVMLNFPQVVADLQTDAPFAELRRSLAALYDGFAWKPLSSKWDYAATYRRIVKEVFAVESESVTLK